MQPIESECDGCGTLVRTTQDGDRCGACEVTVCRACLSGTARCPSCQRRFAETRAQRPAASRESSLNYPRVLGVVALLSLGGAFAYIQTQTRVPPTRARAVGVISNRAAPAAPASCATVKARYRQTFVRLSSLRLIAPAPDRIAEMLSPALGALDARVRSLRPLEGLPLEGPVGAMPASGYGLHFNITDWADPRVGENASGGRVTGRIFVERQSPRAVLCVAEVDHRGEISAPPESGDALGTARIALILGALEAGVESLVPAR